ncbi:hypothetical protein [Paracoccus aminophilus]|uniref:hypothetical protein n=1 Tax=Paracoccus aminophilus TaxID=34003 RepID=UPI00041A32FF|nr:hypothetical protein [Paracoccus aminophilus]
MADLSRSRLTALQDQAHFLFAPGFVAAPVDVAAWPLDGASLPDPFAAKARTKPA